MRAILISALLFIGTAVAQHYEIPQKGLAKAFMNSFVAGGPVRNAEHRLLHKPFNVTHTGTGWRGEVKDLGNGYFEQKFLSAPLTIKSGEIDQVYVPIDWPVGHIQTSALTTDVMLPVDGLYDANDAYPVVKKSVREDVYVHHYTVNRWQLSEKDFKDLVNGGGVDFDATNIGLALKEAGITSGSDGPCGAHMLHAVTAGGDEKRGKPNDEDYIITLPDGYGFEFDDVENGKDGMVMMLNAHLIDLHNVTNLRGCAECACEFTHAHLSPIDRLPIFDGRKYEGGLECCHSSTKIGGGAKCGIEGEQKEWPYHFETTIRFRKYDPEIKQVDVMWFDSSDTGAVWNGFTGGEIPIGGSLNPITDRLKLPGTIRQPHTAMMEDQVTLDTVRSGRSGITQDVGDCHAEYIVPACDPSDPADPCVHTFWNSWIMPFDCEIVAVYSHLHVGGANMTSFFRRQGEYDTNHLCTAIPSYTKTSFGQDRLEQISNCRIGGVPGPTGKGALSGPVQIKKGDEVILKSVYTQDELPHYGVMGYFVIVAHRFDIEGKVKFSENVTFSGEGVATA